MNNKLDDFLEHVGILGMKWGVRRGRNSTSSGGANKDSIKKRKLTDSEEVSILKKRTTKGLSNDDLKKITSRLDLEKRYKELNPSKMASMKKFTSEILGNAAKTILTKALIKLGSKKMDDFMKTKKSPMDKTVDDILKDFSNSSKKQDKGSTATGSALVPRR